jgi:hypothetical protein
LDAKCKKASSVINENSKRLTELMSNESHLVLSAHSFSFLLSYIFLVSLVFCYTVVFLLLPSIFIYIFIGGASTRKI